jgi:hypothetical protein
LTIGQVAAAVQESPSNVSRWYAGWQQQQLDARRQEVWERPPEIEALLEPTAEAFAAWRARYFTDPFGKPFITPAVQRKWIRAILIAITRGRRQMILTPPRHGKTEMLIHFCIWLICRNPNIRILWVGPNDKIAWQSGQSVIDQLANNEKLIAEILGPGKAWKPSGRGGTSWTASKSTVATRTITGLKSPTMACIGKGGELVSRDADFIVGDDIVSLEDANSPAARDALDQWFTMDLSSRKQDHTGLVLIGSRRGHKDLFGTIEKNPAWASIVEHAHDPECELPTHSPVRVEEHDECAICPPIDFESEDITEACAHVRCEICAAHVDCMLIPELASFHFLQNQRTATPIEAHFEMVYQNITRSDGAEHVTLEHLKRCRNHRRRLGHGPNLVPITPGKHDGLRLIGGLDPATAGFQASFLWGYESTTRKRYLVDLDNRRAGGLAGARAIIRDWYFRYGLKTWVVESIGYQEAIMQDKEIVEFCATHGIVLIPHITDRWNKFSMDFGVMAQFELFKGDAPLIDLPYADEATIDVVRQYENQVLDFEPETKAKRSARPSDLVMAGWFPETQIRYWQVESATQVTYEHAAAYSDVQMGDLYEPAMAGAWN